MPTNFMDLKKMLGGGGDYAKIFLDLKKCLGGGLCQNILGQNILGI